MRAQSPELDAMERDERRGQKAFGLRDSGDMINKLRWELSNLFWRQRYDIAVCQYHSFNCAVTAWHAIDWLWCDISNSQEVLMKLQEETGKPLKGLGDFQGYVRENCDALRLCHLIANGSKHFLVTRNPDPAVSAHMSSGEGYDYGNPIIMDGDTCYMAITVFSDALRWLESFVTDWNIFPEEPFVPMDDQ